MQEAEKPRWRREVLSQACALLALLAVAFPGVVLRGELLSGADLLFDSPPWMSHRPAGFDGPGNVVMPDIVTAMVPYYVLTERSIAQGQWPLWNPLEMAGMPLLANFQSAVFYPPRLLHAFLDLHLATSIYYLLKLFLCGMTAFLCARGLGLGVFAARFFSIAWMLNGFNFVWCYWPLPDVCAWLPVLFYGVEMAARGQARAGVFGIGAGGALMLLAGHPETAFTEALGVGVYLAVRLALAWPGWRATLRAAGVCCAGWALALGVTASVWLPFVEYLLNSYTLHERAGDDYGNYVSPIGMVTWFVPRFLGTNAEDNFWGENSFNIYSYYPALITWVGACIACALLRDRVRRPMVGGLLAAAVTCLLWSFAVPGTLALFSLPGLHALRLNYNIAFAVFALCLLGAAGLERWVRTGGTRGGWLAIAMGVAIGSAVVYGVYGFNKGLITALGVAPQVTSQLLAAGAMLLFTLAALVLCTLKKARRAAPVVLLYMLVFDLTYSLRGMNPTIGRDHIFPPTDLTTALQALPQPARVQAGAGYIASGLLVPYGIEDWLGYDGLFPDRVLRFNLALGTDVWNAAEPVCSIEWYLHNPALAEIARQNNMEEVAAPFPVDDTSYFAYVASYDGLELYRNKRALPRAYVAGAVQSFPDREGVFEALESEAFVPGTVVYTESAPTGPLPDTPGPAGTADIASYTPNEVRVAVHAARAGALVLSDAFFPGWTATVNGAAAEIFPAYYAFRGVLVPAGESEVVFTYFPWTFRVGMGISVVTLLVGGGAAIWTCRQRGGRTSP